MAAGTSEDDEFVKQLFDQYQVELRRYLGRRLQRSALDATDVAQETYLRLLRVENTSLIRTPRAYLYRVANNVARELELKEHAGQIDSYRCSEDLAEMTASPQNSIDGVEHESSLHAAVQGMPATQLTALLLLKRDGMTYQEIATELDLTVNTVKKYLFEAVKHCRQRGWR